MQALSAPQALTNNVPLLLGQAAFILHQDFGGQVVLAHIAAQADVVVSQFRVEAVQWGEGEQRLLGDEGGAGG
jgi:hypothetical protein